MFQFLHDQEIEDPILAAATAQGSKILQCHGTLDKIRALGEKSGSEHAWNWLRFREERIDYF